MSASGGRIGATATSTVVGAGAHLSDLADNADSVQLGDPVSGPGVGFIDSNEELRFVLDPASPDPQYGYTEIPSLVEAYGWRADHVTDTSSTLARVRGIPARGVTRLTVYTREAYTDFVVFYKDPHVVAIPAALGGGWLMILARARVLRSAAVEEASGGDVVAVAALLETAAGSAVFGDVVAYRCESQLFRGDTLTGPYLLVDSLRAVGSRYGTVRAWCGAPTGAFLDTGDAYPELHVYYNAEVYVEGSVLSGDDEEAIAQANAAVPFLDGGIGHARISGELCGTRSPRWSHRRRRSGPGRTRGPGRPLRSGSTSFGPGWPGTRAAPAT